MLDKKMSLKSWGQKDIWGADCEWQERDRPEPQQRGLAGQIHKRREKSEEIFREKNVSWMLSRIAQFPQKFIW